MRLRSCEQQINTRVSFDVKQFMTKTLRVDFVISFGTRKGSRMKILMIIVCVLAVKMMIYAFDAERAERYKEYVLQCLHEFGAHEGGSYTSTFLCAMLKDGRIFSDNDVFIKNATLQFIEDVIFDEGSVKPAQETFKKCYNRAVQNRYFSQEHAKDIAFCISQVMTLYESARPI